MERERLGDLRIASRGRRLAAGVITAMVYVPPFVVAVGLGPKVYRVVTGKSWDPDALELPARWQKLLAGVPPTLIIQRRNCRSPGERLMRIRRADARTGGPVTARSALIRYLAGQWLSAISAEASRPFRQRRDEERRRLEPEIQRIRDQHPGDNEAVQRALMRLYQESGYNPFPFRSCAWTVIPGLALNLPTFWSATKQSVADLICGTVVIET
jgi:uncharacterized RDD family membrane protein YckC